ncbi:DUF6448 family protein [Marinobacter sp.]|uniref:DUF6448 family protein n=1 Tax=Marinobacter sp. TaxID=50741 RepID=UPI0038504EAA
MWHVPDTYRLLLLTSIIQSLSLAVFLLLPFNVRLVSNRLLVATLVSFAAWLGEIFLYGSGLALEYPDIACLGTLLGLLQAGTLYLYATLVKVHRASEGAPYTGIKPPGQIDRLVENITGKTEDGIRERYEEARRARTRADQSVEKGRDFVTDYVNYIHYVEGVHGAAGGGGHQASLEYKRSPCRLRKVTPT